MIILRNDFHNSRACTKGGHISRATVLRLRRELCGIGGCTCGGNLGERGRQDAEIIPHEDGSVTVLPSSPDES